MKSITSQVRRASESMEASGLSSNWSGLPYGSSRKKRTVTCFVTTGTVLIVGGAGGVGSLAIQLLKALTPATVIATASRPETIAWTRDMGTDHVIGRAIVEELEGLGIPVAIQAQIRDL
jgi:NADPH:quinone reductase-like Zn-dependent oxidoreductase